MNVAGRRKAKRSAREPRAAQEIAAPAKEAPLRDRKKATQRTNLLRIAYVLFRKEGFDQVRLEDIAFHANVSVPTFYNYFSNKRDLLIAILMQDRKDGAPSYEKVLANPPGDPGDAIAELIYANVAIIRSPSDKRLWREIFAAVALSHDREQDAFNRNHQSFKTYIKRLLQHFVDNQVLPPDYPLDLASDLIFALNAQNLRRLAASKCCTPEDIRDLTRRQMRLLLRRNEDAVEDIRPPSPRKRAIPNHPVKKRSRPERSIHVQNKA
ncbi:TetR/AcrR family transcriptional regulator [Dongia soli]|uniref:TetR/AcrR family transcriptional regulator n=1 Tax=Dongia soli TaxID=600628 RepID=A0ABU5EDC4_9PROT|nr:TetR/AcrR family transcriptional regulator [Dongia soli]MDY0884341.1 TetR/AcrR family transcriptional regulator [Dongia soli]